ncbi:membrane protein [Paenibacillus darwinianus]|uniref:Membrane protein n=1 Tax=Paenibacillus darwinianus TaxID=1380763 RepID=A0A9W5S3T7_9BACL|nr:YitT family protein [Paenibacillus darwinianus]EXX92118.1 membrane protein [Paenibacillus darwinianus]EXX92553.1 membrane protein [Paenibacillus darwinianus]
MHIAGKGKFRTSLAAKWRVAAGVAAGTAIYAFGLHYFVLPNQFMEGGVTGIGILLNYAFGLKLSLTTLLLNIPIFIAGWRLLGLNQMVMAGFGTISLAFFLWVMERLIGSGHIVPFSTDRDLLLSALYAGVTLGAGLGVVFRFGATTGGVDIIARIVSKGRGWSMGQIILTLDAVVIGLSLLFIPVERVLYTLVVVFIATKLIDFIQEGVYSGKAFSIITTNGQAVADAVMRELERGVTIMPAVGGYSGTDKQVVFCVVGRQEVRLLKQLVLLYDPKAFIVISEAHDVIGEGFRES